MSDLSTWDFCFFFLGALLHYSRVNHEVSRPQRCKTCCWHSQLRHHCPARPSAEAIQWSTDEESGGGQSIQWTELPPYHGAYELSFPTTADSYWLNRVEADGGYGWFCHLQEEYTVENLGFIDQLCNWGWHNLVAFLWSQSITHLF